MEKPNNLILKAIKPKIPTPLKQTKHTFIFDKEAWDKTFTQKEHWSPLPVGHIKANYDVATRPYFLVAAKINDKGEILKVEASHLSPGGVNTGEAKAAALAISLAASLGNSPLILEGDSQMVAMAINHPENSLQTGTSSQSFQTSSSGLLSSKAGLHLRLPKRQIPKLMR
jgi:hypothetical protein